MAGWLRVVIGSAIGDEVGVQSDPVQPRVLVAPVDADPVGNQFGVQRGAHGGRQLLNAGYQSVKPLKGGYDAWLKANSSDKS